MILELTEVWRQADPAFVSLLQAVRLGRWAWSLDRATREGPGVGSGKGSLVGDLGT